VAIAVFPFPEAADRADAGALFGLSIATVLLLAFVGLSVASAVGLFARKEWGRIAAIVHAAVSLIRIPFGTVIGILVLVYLTRAKTRDYFQESTATPGEVEGGI
jgi:uncharacterized membrane protein (DUF2068 family)